MIVRLTVARMLILASLLLTYGCQKRYPQIMETVILKDPALTEHRIMLKNLHGVHAIGLMTKESCWQNVLSTWQIEPIDERNSFVRTLDKENSLGRDIDNFHLLGYLECNGNVGLKLRGVSTSENCTFGIVVLHTVQDSLKP